MSDIISATYAKAIDDLSGKIFMPGMIMALLVDAGPYFKEWWGLDNLSLYITCVLLGLFLSGTILAAIGLIQYYFFSDSENSPPIVGIMIMPLGFAALFPSYFGEFTMPLSQVSGMAIIAWSFMLLNFDVFDNEKS